MTNRFNMAASLASLVAMGTIALSKDAQRLVRKRARHAPVGSGSQ